MILTEEFDARLKERLLRMEEEMPKVSATRGGDPMRLSVIILVLVGVLGVATGAAATTVVLREVTGSAPGVFSGQGPLHCSGIHQMAAVDADPLLRELGYNVMWQIEDRDAKTSVQSTAPPSDGFIVEGAIIGGDLILVVERGEDVEPVPNSCP